MPRHNSNEQYDNSPFSFLTLRWLERNTVPQLLDMLPIIAAHCTQQCSSTVARTQILCSTHPFQSTCARANIDTKSTCSTQQHMLPAAATTSVENGVGESLHHAPLYMAGQWVTGKVQTTLRVAASLPFLVAAASAPSSLHGWEGNHVPDAGVVSQQHHQPIHTNAQPTTGRHAVFQCRQEVIVDLQGGSQSRGQSTVKS